MVVIPTYGNYTDDDTVDLEHRPTVSARRYVILHIINSNAQYHAAITSHGTLNVILGIRHYPLHRLPYHLDRRQRHNDWENDYGYRFQLCPSYRHIKQDVVSTLNTPWCTTWPLTDTVLFSDSMVQPQMDQDRSRNISNLDLVEPNWIRDSIYTCIRLLFVNFMTLKMSHRCTYHLTM